MKHHSPSSSSEHDFSTVYRANSAMVLEPLVWNTSPGACDVEPPAANSGPCSMTTTSDQPRRTSSSASEQPTIPAPMIATRGVDANVGISSRDRNGAGDRAIADPLGSDSGALPDHGIQADHLASFSATHLSPASSALIPWLVM